MKSKSGNSEANHSPLFLLRVSGITSQDTVDYHERLLPGCSLFLMPAPHASIRTLFLEGPVGRLEALLNLGQANATHSGLVCHPHPLFGGTMHNKVVFHAAKALHSFGFPVLRFNFRGTGLSEGKHDGREEVADVQAALAWLKQEYSLPILFAGFSFGAARGLRACCTDVAVQALISLGTPVEAEGRLYSYKFLAYCRKPKLFLSGDRDQFGPHDAVEEIVAQAADPKELVFIPGDHFFAGHLDEMRMTVESWLHEVLDVRPGGGTGSL